MTQPTSRHIQSDRTTHTLAITMVSFVHVFTESLAGEGVKEVSSQQQSLCYDDYFEMVAKLLGFETEGNEL
ncbi:hypothetical protein TNCV_1220231 [Trichonephila clavipes]|nr:hypothetical protein TNCV_1220231 [Trichonephila clavipes]